MYHRTICNHPDIELTEKDRKEVYDILKLMMKSGASTHYANYARYQEPFEQCLQQIHEITHIQQYEPVHDGVPPFIEDDKTLLVKPKSKSILELFSKVKKI